MDLNRGADIVPGDRASPREALRLRRAAQRMEPGLLDAMIAQGRTIEAMVGETGATKHAVAVAIEHWLRRNPRRDIVLTHMSPADLARMEEAVRDNAGSLKKALAMLGGATDIDLLHVVRGYCVGASTGHD